MCGESGVGEFDRTVWIESGRSDWLLMRVHGSMVWVVCRGVVLRAVNVVKLGSV